MAAGNQSNCQQPDNTCSAHVRTAALPRLLVHRKFSQHTLHPAPQDWGMTARIAYPAMAMRCLESWAFSRYAASTLIDHRSCPTCSVSV
jgi:hypothetical protein